jgi:hypothetical protein
MGSVKGDRLADGAVRLAREYPKNVTWSLPGINLYGHRPFSDWLHSREPLPQAVDAFRQFMSSTDMNCYQWVILAALRSGAIDRPTAIRYYDSIAPVPAADKNGSLKALYGANQPHPMNVEYAQDSNGRWSVKTVKGRGVDLSQRGDLMTFDEKDHVMVIADKDGQGHLLVASFPRFVWGDRVGPGPAEAYLGAFENFLQAHLDDWVINDNSRNYLKSKEILTGPPAFI